MAEERIFVGRKNELEQFDKVLKEPKGQAVLVVGQAGMGKTWLVNEVAKLAEKRLLRIKGDKLKCWSVCYRVTPTDNVNTIMEQIIVDATEAASPIREKLGMTGANKEKWGALFGVGEFVPVFGKKIRALGDLLLSWGQKKTGETRKRFVQALAKLSDCMSDNQRAIFIIDPEKYLQDRSDYAWGLVVDELPDKIKFVFPQRPDDVIVKGEGFDELDNVVRIPEGELRPFDEQNIEELLSIQSEKTPELEEEVRSSVKRSDKSPYAVTGTLELITSAGMKAEDLAQYLNQEDVAEAQWRGVCERGDGAVRLFKAYAILEVAVPDDVVEAVSDLKSSERKKLLEDKFLRGLMREEDSGRIYHSILADYISGQISKAEKKEIHKRAVEVYREKLAEAKKKQTKPDTLSAMRLAEHVLEAEGEEAFVDAFVNECFGFLLRLGLLDAATGLSMRALKFVKKDSKDEVSVMGDIGIIYKMRGALNKAEEIFKRILEIHKKIGPEKHIASDCANLGGIYVQLGMLEKAENMFESALEIDQKLGNLYEVGDDYGKFGVLYIKRKDFHKAEQALKKAITIHEEIERFDGVATNCGNLGRLYIKERKYNLAEQMFLKALELHKKLGWLEGLAHDNVNLGSVCEKRGDNVKAKEYYEKAVELYKKIGMPHMVEKVESWIDKLNIKNKNAK
jgi:tetratricopeptide (TPR) repeat protein